MHEPHPKDPDTQRLTTVLDVIQSSTDAAFPDSVVKNARRIASELPCVAYGGFEFDLCTPVSHIDVLQFFDFHGNGAAHLASFVAQTDRAEIPPWSDIARIAEAWGRADAEWMKRLQGIWIEIDANGFSPEAWTPSVFLEFSKDGLTEADDLDQACQAMGLGHDPDRQALFDRIARQLPQGARVSHIGGMFGRQKNPIRLNIKGIAPDDVMGFGSSLGLKELMEPFVAILRDACRGTICLDILDGLLPRAGLEYSYFDRPTQEIGWERVSRSAPAAPVNATSWSAFQDWPCHFMPATCGSVWPDTLILEQLADHPDALSGIECKVSHIKLTVSQHAPPTLKGYVGFRPTWRPFQVALGRAARQVTAAGARETWTSARQRALGFLLDRRRQDGLWQDFSFSRMASDEWISGFVGAQLAALDETAARTAASRAFDALQARRRNQLGWGYCAHTPPDADSTAWVLILADCLGQGRELSLLPRRDFLAAHLSDKAGMQTYDAATLAQLGTGLPGTNAHRLWHTAQAEITASAALAGLDAAAAVLPGLQRPDGSWPSFWMEGNAYATGLSLLALSGNKHDLSIRRGVDWCMAQLDVLTRPFDMAWLLHGISVDPDPSRHLDALRRVWTALLSCQKEDGSWPSSCVMLVPMPGEKNGEVDFSAYPDHAGVFTTATVLGAMEKMSSLLEDSSQ